MPAREIDRLLGVLDRGYDRKSWHGTNLKGSLRGLTLEELCWRPTPERHDIWEVVVHAAYWKYVVRRRLTGGPKGGFALSGSDWFERPAPGIADEAAWKADVALLDAEHAALRRAIAGLAAAHDLYHAGQIQLLKRMARQAR